MLIKKSPSEFYSHLQDSSNLQGGTAEELVIPEDEKEVAKFLAYLSDVKKVVTTSGSNTGTTGGAIPFGGTILSTEKLDKIISIDEKNKTAVVETGVTLLDLSLKLKAYNLFYPPDPTEKTATVGGTISTNASGGRSFKYGATRNWINGLDIVLSS